MRISGLHFHFVSWVLCRDFPPRSPIRQEQIPEILKSSSGSEPDYVIIKTCILLLCWFLSTSSLTQQNNLTLHFLHTILKTFVMYSFSQCLALLVFYVPPLFLTMSFRNVFLGFFLCNLKHFSVTKWHNLILLIKIIFWFFHSFEKKIRSAIHITEIDCELGIRHLQKQILDVFLRNTVC